MIAGLCFSIKRVCRSACHYFIISKFQHVNISACENVRISRVYQENKRNYQKVYRNEIPPKWSLQLPLIDLSPFPGSWTHLGASRGLKSQKRGPYLAIFGPSLTPLPTRSIFLVQNSLYRCPTYSTTCFMLNSYLWGVFLALWSQI